MNNIAFLLSTIFGLGKVKYAPGTLGSIVAFPISYSVVQLITEYDINFFNSEITLNSMEQQVLTLIVLLFILTVALFIIGIFASNIYMKKTGIHDPKEIIIDEVVGQMLVICLSVFTLPFAHNSNITLYLDATTIDWIYIVILPFIFFRAFDIIKPWPINLMDEKIPGGVGVMLDDVAAAIFASVLHYALLFVVMDWVNG